MQVVDNGQAYLILPNHDRASRQKDYYILQITDNK